MEAHSRGPCLENSRAPLHFIDLEYWKHSIPWGPNPCRGVRDGLAGGTDVEAGALFSTWGLSFKLGARVRTVLSSKALWKAKDRPVYGPIEGKL